MVDLHNQMSNFSEPPTYKYSSQALHLLHLPLHNTTNQSNPMGLLSPTSLLSIFFSLFLLSLSSTAALSGNTSTVYEVLQEYGFPVGILPKGALGYELDNSTGEFSVYFNTTCKFSIDSYELEYKSTITGVVTKDELKSLSGIKVKVYFLWLSIVEVILDDEELEFSVGIASADFPAANFVESPTCGCGFDCDTANRNRLVSSY